MIASLYSVKLNVTALSVPEKSTRRISEAGGALGCARVLQHPALVALGEYSFAVYLFQLPLIDFAILVFGDTSWSNPVTQGWVLFVVFWLAAAYSRLVDVPFSRLLRGATAGWEHRGEAKLQESKV